MYGGQQSSSTPGVTGGQGRGVSYSIGYQGPKYRVGGGGKLIQVGRRGSGGACKQAPKKKPSLNAQNWSRILYGSGGKQSITVAGVTDLQFDLEAQQTQATLGSGSLGG